MSTCQSDVYQGTLSTMRRHCVRELAICRTSTGITPPPADLSKVYMYCILGLPLPLLPLSLPATHSSSSLPCLIMCPKNLFCLCPMFWIIYLLAGALCNTLMLVAGSTQNIRSILLRNHISAATIFFCIALLMFQASYICIAMLAIDRFSGIFCVSLKRLICWSVDSWLY